MKLIEESINFMEDMFCTFSFNTIIFMFYMHVVVVITAVSLVT